MRLIAGICLAFLIVSTPVYARSCVEVERADQEIKRAATRDDVGSVLKRLGAPPKDVDNMVRASPDVDVARATALRAIEKLRAACTK